MKRIFLGLCVMTIYGCASPAIPNTNSQNKVAQNVVTPMEIKPQTAVQTGLNGITAKSLEGRKYQVFLGAAYAGIRDQLKDGEVLTLKDVVFEQAAYGQGYYKAHYLDSRGSQIFADYYALSDVGLLDSRMMAIDTTVSDEKVNQGRGEVLHGKTPDQTGEYMTYLYLSTSNGDSARAYPVSLQKGQSKAKSLGHGLSFSCRKGQVFGVATFTEPFIAINEGAELKFSFPNRVKMSVRGEAIDSESVFFAIPRKLEKMLTSSEAGELWVHPDANGPERSSWRNNGLSEAYMRVKRHCS